MYEGGLGVPQDFAEAIRWYRKAAEQGDAGALNSLGGMYRKGVGVPQDFAKAIHWYRKAAEQGNVDAQSVLGEMYFNGQGAPRDFVQAYMWVNVAAVGGNKRVAQFRDSLEYKMTAEQLAEAQKRAAAWVSKHPRPSE
jgi:TPR repeat protein